MQITSYNSGAFRVSSSAGHANMAGRSNLAPGAAQVDSASQRLDRADIGSRVGGENTGGMGESPQARLDAIADRYNDRIDDLLEGGTLSADEKAGVLAAQDTFNQSLERLSNAFMGENSGSSEQMAKGFAGIMQTLRSDVASAMGHSDGLKGGRANGVGRQGGQEGPRVGGKPDDAGRHVGREHASVNDRLDAAESRIETRLANLLDKSGLDERGLNALQGAHDDFSASLERLRGAFANGDMSRQELREGFSQLLSQLRDSVQHVLGASNDSDPIMTRSVGARSEGGAPVDNGATGN